MIKTIAYKNGQVLSYTEAGDAGGFPVLVQHGMVASIKDQHWFDLLVRAGARVISIARPGYGESSPYALPSVGEWGEIVSLLAAHLRLERFDVFGISSGAPYAYAIGYHMPERVRRIYILSGIPALYDPEIQACWPYPLNQQAGMDELQPLARKLFFAHLTPDDLQRDDIRDSLRNNCFGPALDLKIRCLDWGFTLPEVRASVYMRHSLADGAEAVKMALLTARLLPNCQVELRENDPHFSQEVLDDFIQTVMVRRLGG